MAACIDTVDNLPDDADVLIHELLSNFPTKPPQSSIVGFLNEDIRVGLWFREQTKKPKINKFDLNVHGLSQSRDAYLPPLDTMADLAEWLNISYAQLEWLADFKRYDAKASDALKHYVYNLVKKRNGGPRLIEAPKKILKGIQTKITDRILAHALVHDAAHGFRAGRSCKTHASLHVGKQYLLLFDLQLCFQSIQWSQVYLVFLGLGYSPSVTKYLTGLCTHRAYPHDKTIRQLGDDQRELLAQRHLAQGAPSSPALSNAVLIQLDRRLSGLSHSLKSVYSRYADDLAFSMDVHRDWQFLEPLVGSICLEEGLALNFRKTRILRPHQRQKVTGVVVNTKPNVDRRYYDRLKAILWNCIRDGIHLHNRLNHPDFRAQLLGRVQHVRYLDEAKGEKLLSMFKRIG